MASRWMVVKNARPTKRKKYLIINPDGQEVGYTDQIALDLREAIINRKGLRRVM